MKYKLIVGLAIVDQEKYPEIKSFEAGLDDAVAQLYAPVFSTFRVTRVEGNIMFTILAESITEPAFIGGK